MDEKKPQLYPHSLPHATLKLPRHFSLLSAQTSKEHSEEAHQSLQGELKTAGYKHYPVKGHWGYPEKSFMVIHRGTPEDHKKLEEMAWRHKQQAVLHSSELKNRVVHQSGKPEWHGEGMSQGQHWEDMYTELPSGRKINLHVVMPEETEGDVKKSQEIKPIRDPKETYQTHVEQATKAAVDAAKPKYYGKVNGIHVLHATHPAHDSLVGLHVHNPSDRELEQHIEDISSKGGHIIVIHGKTPHSLEHAGTLGLNIEKSDLEKAFTQGDGETLTDPREHNTANAPKELMEWGANNLVPLKPDGLGEFELHGAIIKVRKVIEDLYSGWIEKEGKHIHVFEKLTLPSLLVQIQSKLELYGEGDVVGKDKEKEIKMNIDEVVDEHEKLVDTLKNPTPEKLKEEAKEQGKELVEYKEKQKISNKIGELKQKIQDSMVNASETQEVVPGKDLVPGIENPEKECPACERPVEQCICYTGLPKPRVEFDGKKVTIFFKSEWDAESKESFLIDMKKRVSSILQRKRVEEARTALDNIRKKIK